MTSRSHECWHELHAPSCIPIVVLRENSDYSNAQSSSRITNSFYFHELQLPLKSTGHATNNVIFTWSYSNGFHESRESGNFLYPTNNLVMPHQPSHGAPTRVSRAYQTCSNFVPMLIPMETRFGSDEATLTGCHEVVSRGDRQGRLCSKTYRGEHPHG